MDVKTIAEELHHTLERQVALHGSLVELLRLEYVHMGALDATAMAEDSRAKEAIMAEIWSLEQLRIKATQKLAPVAGLIPASATLAQLAERMPLPHSDRLRAARTALNLLVVEAKNLNTRNMSFVQGSLARIDQMKRNVLGLSGNGTMDNYSNSGVRKAGAEQGGRLLSTEA